ncbi:MAG: S8 family serine peptidase [Isosphaeraceae bacterium]
MAWTRIRIGRRDSARRHQPGVELLDERCLLSTGAGTALSRLHPHAVRGTMRQANNQVGTLQSRLTARRQAASESASPAPLAATTEERPAGTITTGVQSLFDPIIGAAQARAAYGVDGRGMTVAVIDTGVDYTNPALGGRFGAGAKVVAGYNFASNTADPMATASQHGTAVAGLIASTDPKQPGVAPGVNLVALRVVGDNNSAQLSSIARALQWVIDHRTEHNITAVNMSLSDGGNYAQNWFAHDGGVGQQITELVGKLKALNIPVISATGNSFKGQQGEGFTSIVSGVISVTATDTSNQLLPDAQRLGDDIGNGNGTELAAPGKGLLAPSGSNQQMTVDGTSFAAPLVTGSVVLLQQIYQSRFGTLPTVDQVTQWLEKGADPINDPVTGITIGRLDVPGAAALVPAAAATTKPPSQVPPAPVPTPAISYVPVVSNTPTPTPSAPIAAQTLDTTTAPTPAPTAISNAPTVQVFLNGRQVSSAETPSSGPRPSPAQGRLDSLLRAMSAWASQGDGGPTSQMRVWKAAAQPAGGIANGTAFPSGNLAVRASRGNRFANR